MVDLAVAAVIMLIVGLAYLSGYRDQRTQDKHKALDKEGRKWVP